jgi:hypothetical protein
MGYIYCYNNVREHSSLGYETPFANLKRKMPDLDDSIRAPIPVLLDKVVAQLGPWNGHNVLAQHRLNLRRASAKSGWPRSCPTTRSNSLRLFASASIPLHVLA